MKRSSLMSSRPHSSSSTHLILLGPLLPFCFSQVTYRRVFWFFAQNDLGPVSLPLCSAFRFRKDLVSSFLSQSPRKQACHTGWVSHDGSQSFPQELSFEGFSAKICNLKVWFILIGNTEQFVKLNTFLLLEETEILKLSGISGLAPPGTLVYLGTEKK